MTLSNGDKIMLVEVPESEKHFRLMEDCRVSDNWFVTYPYPGAGDKMFVKTIETNIRYGIQTKILGTYHKGEIDFEVKEEWVYGEPRGHLFVYEDYEDESNTNVFLNAKESFLSLLQSLSLPDKKYVVLLIKK